MIRFMLVLGIAAAFLFSTTYAQPSQKKSLPTTPKSGDVKDDNSKKKDLPKTETTAKSKKEKKKPAPKPIKGRVVSLNSIMKSQDGKVTKEQAMEFATKGQPIVFMAGEGKKGKIYFVYNTDGSFAGKDLARYADSKSIGIIGKSKSMSGVNIIIAEKIEPLN